MKKIYYLVFVQFFVLHATGQECIGDSQFQLCCNDLISTDPYNGNAHNPERPDLINTFDWLISNGTQFQHNFVTSQNNTIESPFNLGEPKYKMISNYPFIPTPSFNMNNHIMHPKYGWELMFYYMGFEKLSTNPQTTGSSLSGPVLFFYNKYTGELRVLMSP